MLPIALAWRLARRLQESRTADEPGDQADEPWERLVRSWALLGRRRERWLKARGRWPTAAGATREEFAGAGRAFAREVGDARSSFAPAATAAPGVGDIYADIRQLEAEFESVAVRWKEKVLVATTEAITLRGVELGPFAIELHWEARCEPGSRFEIVALEPNPAAGGKGDVTHPHVRDRHLCAGEAVAPLRKALEDGRIADAFVLVRSVLRTYNPSSPYTPLAEWGGSPCRECGRNATGDERYCCEGCDADFCGECTSGCARCDSTRCAGCLDPCALCRQPCCSSCLTDDPDGREICTDCWRTCDDCDRRVPKDRLENRLCPECPTEEDPDDDDDADESAGDSDPGFAEDDPEEGDPDPGAGRDPEPADEAAAAGAGAPG